MNDENKHMERQPLSPTSRREKTAKEKYLEKEERRHRYTLNKTHRPNCPKCNDEYMSEFMENNDVEGNEELEKAITTIKHCLQCRLMIFETWKLYKVQVIDVPTHRTLDIPVSSVKYATHTRD
jgi:hypothetical protein